MLGRPSTYTPELANSICGRIILGFSLRTICKDESMPCPATVFNWLRSHPDFLDQYEKAKEQQADALAEDILDIADDGTNDWMEQFGKDGNAIGWQVNGENIQRSRLRVDARKWIAAKLKPKKYADAMQQEPPKPQREVVIIASDQLRGLLEGLAAAKRTGSSVPLLLDQSGETGTDNA